MKIFVLSISIIAVFSCSNERKALDYYDTCVDLISCDTDQSCYDKDIKCMEITEDLFYGKISDKEADQLIDKMNGGAR